MAFDRTLGFLVSFGTNLLHFDAVSRTTKLFRIFPDSQPRLLVTSSLKKIAPEILTNIRMAPGVYGTFDLTIHDLMGRVMKAHIVVTSIRNVDPDFLLGPRLISPTLYTGTAFEVHATIGSDPSPAVFAGTFLDIKTTVDIQTRSMPLSLNFSWGDEFINNPSSGIFHFSREYPQALALLAIGAKILDGETAGIDAHLPSDRVYGFHFAAFLRFALRTVTQPSMRGTDIAAQFLARNGHEAGYHLWVWDSLFVNILYDMIQNIIDRYETADPPVGPV